MTTTCPGQSDGVVTLRPPVPDDAAALHAGEDDELVRWLTGSPGSPALALRWIDDAVADRHGDWYAPGASLAWVLCDALTGDLAGTVEVQLAAPDLAPGQANLSYGVFPRHRGRGFAARGVELVLPWLAANTATTLAVIRVDPANVHSMRVPEAAGFRRAGRSRRPGGPRLARFVRPVDPWSSFRTGRL